MNNHNINNNNQNIIDQNNIIINQNQNQNNDIISHNIPAQDIQMMNKQFNPPAMQINPPPAQNKYSFSRYIKAPKTGLVNMGDTSYLNSVLQIIGGLRNFASFFVNPKNVEYINKNMKILNLSFVILRLFKHFYPYPEKNQKEVYKPEYILKVLAQENIVYKTLKRRNPNDLLVFILNSLHKELNKGIDNQLLNINIYNKDNVIFNSIQNYINNNNSVVFNLLNWFEIKEIKCLSCNYSSYSLLTFNTFELDIQGAYKYKNNTITLNDCLQYSTFLRTQILYCKKCQNYNKTLINSKIYSSPNTFIFSLDRKNLDQNLLKIPFRVDEKLNLRNYVENKEAPVNYQLIGILSYYLNEQKYVSFCVSPVDKKWYVYNDEKVEQTNIKSVLDFHNFGKFIPCVLVYKSLVQDN